MKWCSALAMAMVVVVVPEASAQEAVAQEAVAFRDVAVLTMVDDTIRTGRTVVVEDGVITWEGPAGEASIPGGARVIEGRGRFLLPGLADMHAHLEPSDVALFLAAGVTTIRDMNGSPSRVALRDSIAAGQRVGPRLSVTSPLLAGEPQPWRHVLVLDAETARRQAGEAAAAGYDYLKVYDGLSRPAYAALAAESRRLGLPLVGHIPADVGLDAVIEAGQRSIEHVEQITYATVGHSPDADRIQAIAARVAGSGVWVVPTLAAQRILTRIRTPAYDSLLAGVESGQVDPDILAWWRSLGTPAGAAPVQPDSPRRRRAEAFYDFQRDLTRALHDAGVPILVGTDTPNPLLVPGVSIHLELAALADAGIPPLAVLRAATRDAARFLGDDGRGVVAVGAVADLVLADGDPLRDLSVLRDPVGVMVGGTWLDAATLDSMVDER